MSNLRASPPESFTSVFPASEQSFTTSWTGVVAVALLSAYAIQKLLSFIDAPFVSLFEVAWNCFVYLMPSRLAFALSSEFVAPSVDASDAPGTHAAKSEILRRAFGLDKTAIPLQDPQLVGSPPGLGNWDNSCYQNSVLQAFASLESLQGFLVQIGRTLPGVSPTESTLGALQSIVKDLNRASESHRYIWTPPKLKSMSSWQQQDAQEYFSKVVDNLEKDIQAELNRKTLETCSLDLGSVASVATVSSALNTAAQEAESQVRRNAGVANLLIDSVDLAPAATSHMNPLEGLLAQRVGCTRCGYSEGLSLIPFNCITLPLGKEWHYEMRDCLDSFTSLEFIEGVECAKCTLLHARSQLRELLEGNEGAESDEGETELGGEGYRSAVESRLDAVTEALRDEDFTESTLSDKCKIPSRMRTSTTKSRQAIIARAPQCLVLHVNRSLFDETTGNQLKNYANVQFPLQFDLTRWCVGNKMKMVVSPTSCVEEWEMDPSHSMIQEQDLIRIPSSCSYWLKAAITHHGRHENGHYICYRRVPRNSANSAAKNPNTDDDKNAAPNDVGDDGDGQWWRFNDERVTMVTEDDLLSQGGVFMLFYEQIDQQSPPNATQSKAVAADVEVAHTISSQLQQDDETVLTHSGGRRDSVASDPSKEREESQVSNLDSTIPIPKSATSPPALSRKGVEINDRNLTAKTPPPDDDPSEPTILDQAPNDNLRKKCVSPSTMRTAGPAPQDSDEHLPHLTGLRMVATL